jgi:putative transposase
LKELEEENRRLKQMYADLSLEYKALKDVVEKKL